MNDRVRKEQILPDDFASLLRQMRAERDARYKATLAVAHLNGWTYQSMATALGVSRQAVEQAVIRADMDVPGRIPDVPLPPRKPQPEPKRPQRRLLINDELAEELRGMQRVAATVNGATPADAPERKVSVEFTAKLHALVEQGVSMKHLSTVLDLNYNAVVMRLARHGYRGAPTSQSQERYLGRPTQQRETCKRGHPLSGDNLYVVPKSGSRVCRACHAERRNAYLARKQQGGGAA